MIIEKKAWPDLFQKVLDKEKNFDLRLDDFNVNCGDILLLNEWDPEKKQYTGRKLEKEIRFILHTKDIDFWPRELIDEKGFVIMSLGDAK